MMVQLAKVFGEDVETFSNFNHKFLSNYHHELLPFQLSSLILSFPFLNIQFVFNIEFIKTFHL